MTARDHLRVANRRLRREQARFETAPAPRLGEMLQLARERKGVDLYRAERDTKIRLRYLAALEDSDFDELPGAVYTKGFLRNYAIYLGLDPDEVLERWHREMELLQTEEPNVAVAPPPRPLTTPRTLVHLSPGLLVTGLVVLVVIGFVTYLGLQLMRYVESPEVHLTTPSTLVSEVNAEQTTLGGTAGPGAIVNVRASGGQLLTTIADADGSWSQVVSLSPGRNDFTVIASDPVTRRDSPPLNLIISVPLPGSSPTPPTIGGQLSLLVLAPTDEFSSPDGLINVRGSTSAEQVSVLAKYLGPAAGAPSPTPAPTAEPGSSPQPTAAPRLPQALAVAATGAFTGTIELTPGRWQLDITASAPGVQPRTVSRRVTVAPDTAGVEVTLTTADRDSWIRVMADGRVVKGFGSRVLRAGRTHTFTAADELYVRIGNAGAVAVTFNGQSLGTLGSLGEVSNWLFRPGQPPERTTEVR
jgi:cytoskeleton protein RodZ